MNSFNVNGFLIFNFKININNNIEISIYFVEIKNDINRNEELDYKINKFYNYNLLINPVLNPSFSATPIQRNRSG